MPDLFRYSNSFEPLLLEGYTARLHGSGIQEGGLSVKCVAVGALPEYYKDFGALAAATWDIDNTDTNLIMNKWEFSQLRMRVLDDMHLRLKNSQSVSQWRSRDTTFYLPQFPMDSENDYLKNWLWKSSEFFIWEDQSPAFEFYSDFAIATSRVLFSGWRFRVQKFDGQPKFDIWLSDWPTKAST